MVNGQPIQQRVWAEPDAKHPEYLTPLTQSWNAKNSLREMSNGSEHRMFFAVAAGKLGDLKRPDKVVILSYFYTIVDNYTKNTQSLERVL